MRELNAGYAAPEVAPRVERSRPQRKQRAAWLIVTVLVGAFYFWQIGSAFDRFAWSDHLDGYYDLLARGFAQGHLYLPVDPRPELLALPNPWRSPDNRPWRLLDAALYQKRYYLYHGATPAVLLFLPFRLLTHHDLPDDLADFFFCFGGYLLSCELLMEALATRREPVSAWVVACFCAVLGIGSSVPFLLQLNLVYEVAIASGYFFLSAGFFFFFRTLQAPPDQGRLRAALCGLSLGLAVGCRPHLGLTIVVVSGFLLLRRRRNLIPFLLPVIACGAALAVYNYARFGDIREFGLKYQLGEPVYQNFQLSLVNVPLGIYYLLGCPPDLDAVFPFIRLAIRPPFNSVHFSMPERYFLEPTTGAIFLCPLVLLAFCAPFFIRRFRGRRSLADLVLALGLFAVCCVVFIAFTGLNSQRFSVDFLPWLALAGCLVSAEILPRFSLLFIAAVLCSLAVNLLLSIQGPYDQWLRNHPEQFVKVAGWFSLGEKNRPALNPWVRARASFQFPAGCPPEPFHPLIELGKFGSRYTLAAACAGGHVNLYSDEMDSLRVADVPFDPTRQGFNTAEIEYTPATRTMTVRWNGKPVITQPLNYLITAPSQIEYGFDTTLAVKRRFTGNIRIEDREFRRDGGRSQ